MSQARQPQNIPMPIRQMPATPPRQLMSPAPATRQFDSYRSGAVPNLAGAPLTTAAPFTATPTPTSAVAVDRRLP